MPRKQPKRKRLRVVPTGLARVFSRSTGITSGRKASSTMPRHVKRLPAQQQEASFQVMALKPRDQRSLCEVAPPGSSLQVHDLPSVGAISQLHTVEVHGGVKGLPTGGRSIPVQYDRFPTARGSLPGPHFSARKIENAKTHGFAPAQPRDVEGDALPPRIRPHATARLAL